MTKLASYLTASILITASTTAVAERAPQPVERAGRWLLELKAGTLTSHQSAPDTVTRNASGTTTCYDAIEQARTAGVTKFWVPDSFARIGASPEGDNHYLSLAQAEGVCRETAFYNDVVLKDLEVFAGVSTDFEHLAKYDTSISAHELTKKRVDACEPAVDAMLSAGVSPTLPFLFNDKVKVVGDLKAHCALARDTYKRYLEHAKREQVKEREPYLKAGLKGERLEFVMQYDGYIYLPGGATTDNLKKLATAPALFIWNTSDPDASDYVVHTVRKHVFKGNTLVKTYEKTYRKPRGAKLGGGVFK
jgi:hypothetical protein